MHSSHRPEGSKHEFSTPPETQRILAKCSSRKPTMKEIFMAQNSLELKLPSRPSPPFYAKQITLSLEEKNGH